MGLANEMTALICKLSSTFSLALPRAFAHSCSHNMTDRRRNNGPAGGTEPILFSCMTKLGTGKPDRPTRTRADEQLRKVCQYPSYFTFSGMYKSTNDL